jgi:pyruvate/2-oxoglutarate dehydrogenase complex dihydrolipoamide dehydrogenase (E3) component
LIGYQAWFRVAQCERGYVVVNMRTTCAIMDVWAEGDCKVPELR